MKRFWTIRPDNDGERTYYGSVVAETKEQATLMFEVILRRKLNSRWESMDENEAFETVEEIEQEAARVAAQEEKVRLSNLEHDVRAMRRRVLHQRDHRAVCGDDNLFKTRNGNKTPQSLAR